MIARIFTMTGTIVTMRLGAPDVYGNTARVADPVTASVRCYIEQVDAVEVIVDRETYIANYIGFLPAGTAIGPADRLIVAGITYEIIGPPDSVFNPRTATEHHIEVNLRTVVG